MYVCVCAFLLRIKWSFSASFIQDFHRKRWAYKSVLSRFRFSLALDGVYNVYGYAHMKHVVYCFHNIKQRWMHERRRSERQHQEARKYKTPHRIIISCHIIIKIATIVFHRHRCVRCRRVPPTNQQIWMWLTSDSIRIIYNHIIMMTCVLFQSISASFSSRPQIFDVFEKWMLTHVQSAHGRCFTNGFAGISTDPTRQPIFTSHFRCLNVTRKPVDPREPFRFFSVSR